MPTTYTSLLGLALPTTGELTGTWGQTVNDYITKYVDAAVAGTQTLSTDADVTLTVTNGSNLGATSAQYAILNCTGARTVQRTITVPAASKSYLVINGTTGGQSIKVVGAGPTTGVTLVNGERALIAWDGSDFVKVGTNFAAGGSTTQVQYNNAGALAGSANLTFNGTTLTANALTVSTGNLSFSGTAQRITGDFSNATQSSRLAFQTSTVNGNTAVAVLPNGTSTTGSYIAFNNSDPTNAGFVQIQALSTEARLNSSITGTGTYLPMAFYTGGSEAMRIQTSRNVSIGSTADNGNLFVSGANSRVRFSNTAGTASTLLFGADSGSVFLGAETNAPIYFITNNAERVRIDTSGNVAVGTTNAGTAGLSLSQNYNLSWEQSSTESVANLFRQTSSAALVMSVGYKRSATANGFASSFGSSLAKTAISLGTTAGAITFYTDTAATAAVGTDVTPTERMRIDSSGNVGIGTASPGYRLDVQAATASTLLKSTTGTNYVAHFLNNTGGFTYLGIESSTGGSLFTGTAAYSAVLGTVSAYPVALATNGAERMRITATGNIVAGASAALATTATDGFLYVPTCAGTPTGTPTAITGMAPIVVNTTNNKLYFYSGGAWRDAGP